MSKMQGLEFPSCCVLMSTYNGEKYLREQIDSIIAQKGVDWQLLIRDDGSTDKTKEIVNEYSSCYDNIKWYHGKNIGPGLSFIDLVKTAPLSEYYAFSDQDDVWYHLKLVHAISILESERKLHGNRPLLYFGNSNETDEHLCNKKSRLKHLRLVQLDFLGTLFHNYADGHTMVFNSELVDRIRSSNCYNDIVVHRHHDTYFKLCADIVGQSIFDRESLLDFRRHSLSVTEDEVRSQVVITKRVKRMISKFFNSQKLTSNSAKVLLDNFDNDLEGKMKEKLKRIAFYRTSIGRKFCLLMDKEIREYNESSDIVYYIKVFFNKL